MISRGPEQRDEGQCAAPLERPAHAVPDASRDDQRGIIVLCTSLTAGIALAVESVWIWVPWLLVGVTAVAGAYLTLAAVHARPETGDRGDAHAGAD